MRVCEVLAPALEAAAQQQSAEGMEGLSQELERSVREVRAAIQTHAADAPRKDSLLLRVRWGRWGVDVMCGEGMVGPV